MKSMIVRTTPDDSVVQIQSDNGTVAIGSPTGEENIQRIHLNGDFPNGWGAVLTVKRAGYKEYKQRGVLWLSDEPDKSYFTADDFTLEKKATFRKGLVHSVGRSLSDDDGLFYPLGCTLFWALRGWKDEPSRVRENLDYLARFGYDYIRILGDVAWTPELEINSNWPNYVDIARDFIYTAYNDFGLRTELTVYGGGPRDIGQTINKLLHATEGLENAVIHWEVANEAYSNGPDADALMSYGKFLLNATPNLVALSAPPESVPSVAEELSDDFRNANLISMHWSRNYGDDDWRFVRQPWDGKDSIYPYSNNEGKGPLSSVSSCIDPLRLATYRAVSVMCGSGLFVLHNGAGIYGVPNGIRPANLWEVPNADAIHHAVKVATSYFPLGIENWAKANDGWQHPMPVNPIHCIDWTNDVGPVKNYSAISERYFVAIPHGIKNYFKFKLMRDAKFVVYNALNMSIIETNEGGAGSIWNIDLDDTRDNALVLIGEYI